MKRQMYKQMSKEDGKALCLKIDVSYSLGGMNYFNGQRNSRGIYVHFSTVERKSREGYTTESYMPFDGSSFKILVLELKRKSEKKSQIVFDKLKEMEDKLFALYQGMNKSDLLHTIQGINLN